MRLSEEYTVLNPNCCNGPAFAMPTATVNYYKRTGEDWFCPYCRSCRIFVSKTDEEKRIEKLERRLASEQVEKIEAEQRAESLGRQYQRIRDRVKNGVCPCCNRTFQNLANHMATEHPSFGNPERLRTVRLAYGLSQMDLGEEIGLSAGSISKFENDKPVGDDVRERIDAWLVEEGAV